MNTLSIAEPLATAEQIRAIYEELHAHPELSMQEEQTARYLEARLTEIGLTVYRCGGTGVVGILRNGDGPTVAYRADTDGLPVKERTGLPYASTAVGSLDGETVPVMHACGHDIHMTIALLAAADLASRTEEWSGTVVFLFQPGEETAAGANAMVADGLWEKTPRPNVVLGLHVMPLPLGEVHLAAGAVMSQADALRITVHGRGSHGSQPEESIDPIVLAASMIVRLQTVVSRESAPRDAVVLTIGTVHAGLKENVIPDRAEFTVNLRSYSDSARQTAISALERILRGEALASGAPEPEIEVLYRFPLCVNDVTWVERVRDAMAGELGDAAVKVADPRMSSEDVGTLGDSIGVPTVYWFLGGSNPDVSQGETPMNHSPFFAPPPVKTVQTGLASALSAIRAGLAVADSNIHTQTNGSQR